MRIAICDDEKMICDLIKNKIEKYYSHQNTDFQIQLFYSGEEMLKEDGDKTDVSYKTVSDWENGKTIPNIDQLNTLSNIYKVSISNKTKNFKK